MQRAAAETLLKKLQEHPEAWTRVDTILEQSKSQQTKFFGLQVSIVVHCAKERKRIFLVGGWGGGDFVHEPIKVSL